LKGELSYTNLGSAQLDIRPEVLVDGEWIAPGSIGVPLDLTWSNNVLDLSKLSSVTRVRFALGASFDLEKYANAYSVQSAAEDLKFVVRQWNVPSRHRRNHENGVCELKLGKGKSPSKIDCSLQDLIIKVDEFSGEIDLQPLVLTTKTLHDRRRSTATAPVKAIKSSIIGWTDPLTIVLDRSRKGIDSLFDIRWASFKDDGIPGLHDNEFFALRWQARPILYLNIDIEGLHDVLYCEDKTGRRARARDVINSTITHQCLTVALTTSIYAAREVLLESPERDPANVVEQLSPLERLVLREWIHVLDPASNGKKGEWEESLERLLLMEEDEVQRAVVDFLPQSLQTELGSSKAVSELLKSFMEKADSQ
jgi:hypothetical protein